MKLPPPPSTGIPTVDRSLRQLARAANLAAQAAEAQRERDPILDEYQTRFVDYSWDYLGIKFWSGTREPGQLEIARDIEESVELQLKGLPAPQIFRMKGGHGLGKSVLMGALVNFFFDCFPDSITLTSAPKFDQVKRLLWKEVRKHRPKTAPGYLLPEAPEMWMDRENRPGWFAIGQAADNSSGQGSAKVQGQHGPFMCHVYEEAEGIPQFMYSATDAMMTGGQVNIWVLGANPATQYSAFHALEGHPNVKTYQLSLLDFPNVVQGVDIIPGGTTRRWVNEKIAAWCVPVAEHNPDRRTFTVAWDVPTQDGLKPAGTIWMPGDEFQWRVMGVAPDIAERSFVSSARFEAAERRRIEVADPTHLQVGVDAARYGFDTGTVYSLQGLVLRHEANINQQDSFAYHEEVMRAARKGKARGAKTLSIRVDGSGGFGSGLVDLLRADSELMGMFESVEVLEVHFASNPNDRDSYYDIITECYAELAETLLGCRLETPPNELKVDLTARRWEPRNKEGKTVKKLGDKEQFRKDHKRSCDHGDGAALAAAPDHIFAGLRPREVRRRPVLGGRVSTMR